MDTCYACRPQQGQLKLQLQPVLPRSLACLGLARRARARSRAHTSLAEWGHSYPAPAPAPALALALLSASASPSAGSGSGPLSSTRGCLADTTRPLLLSASAGLSERRLLALTKLPLAELRKVAPPTILRSCLLCRVGSRANSSTLTLTLNRAQTTTTASSPSFAIPDLVLDAQVKARLACAFCPLPLHEPDNTGADHARFQSKWRPTLGSGLISATLLANDRSKGYTKSFHGPTCHVWRLSGPRALARPHTSDQKLELTGPAQAFEPNRSKLAQLRLKLKLA